MMLALMIVTCLQSDPTVCRTHELEIYEPVSAMACMMQAPAEIARWHDGRKDWRITRWRCVGDRDERQAKG